MNVTEVVFSGFYKTQICGLYQYDYGQVLKFTDITLPSTYEVHFAQSGASTTVTVLGDSNGVQIPDQYLLADLDIRAYIYLHEEETDGETVYQVLIPVIARPEPTDVEPTPVEQDIITQTIAALNSAVDTAEDYAADASQSASDSAASATSAQAWAEAAQESAESIDMSNYATKAELQSEASVRSLADTRLGNDIDAETQRATQAEASIRLAIPSKTSQLQNDSGFLTSAPVSSVNGKTGAVNLSASDVGALPSSTVIPSKTSDLTNDSGFLTQAVTSVNGQTGAVTLPTATTSSAGLMSSTDKSRLDDLYADYSSALSALGV